MKNVISGLTNQPVAYEKLAKAIVYLLVGFAVVSWTDTQIVLVLAVFESVLGIFVWSSVTPNARVAEKVDAATQSGADEREQEIVAYLAEVADPPGAGAGR